MLRPLQIELYRTRRMLRAVLRMLQPARPELRQGRPMLRADPVMLRMDRRKLREELIELPKERTSQCERADRHSYRTDLAAGLHSLQFESGPVRG
jgi:hypothetical protein